MPSVVRCKSRRGPGWEHGQSMVEVAVAFPLLLMVALGLLQFALFYHAQNVVIGAVQDGARVAASEDRTIAEGVARAEVLLRAGLGQSSDGVSVRGIDGGDAIAIEAQGRLRAIIPWVGDATLPLWARSVVSKERFRVGPGG